MSRVITFSRKFPAYHPKAGQPTYFVEKLCKGLPECSGNDFIAMKDRPSDDLWSLIPIDFVAFAGVNPKLHTIRAGHRWKVGDKFSPRVWSERPYNSPQIIIAPDMEVKKVWDFEIRNAIFLLDNSIHRASNLGYLASNDGLSPTDFLSWFKWPAPFDGQVICWDENVNY